MPAHQPAPPPLTVVDTTPLEAAKWPVRRYRAAGGVVIRDGQALLLRRRRRQRSEVRLPKGHVERGESDAACALREVREETGLRHPTIVAPLGTVENRFAYGGQRYVRFEAWFLMAADDPTMDEPEPHWDAIWLPLSQAETALTYESEKLALRRAVAALARQRSTQPYLRPRTGAAGQPGGAEGLC